MLRWSPLASVAAAVLVLGAVLGRCTSPPDSGETGPGLSFSAEQTAELLPGTWLREYGEKGVQVRRLLRLDAKGGFRETAKVTDPSGQVTRFEHEGTWIYDGTNLKRRYTLMNGKPPSRLNLPFATFEIAFDSRNEFRGVDHIHRNRIHYRRVTAGTSP